MFNLVFSFDEGKTWDSKFSTKLSEHMNFYTDVSGEGRKSQVLAASLISCRQRKSRGPGERRTSGVAAESEAFVVMLVSELLWSFDSYLLFVQLCSSQSRIELTEIIVIAHCPCRLRIL